MMTMVGQTKRGRVSRVGDCCRTSRSIRKPIKIRQANVGHGKDAQSFMLARAQVDGVSVVLVSEPYVSKHGGTMGPGTWFLGPDKKQAVVVLNEELDIMEEKGGDGYALVRWKTTGIWFMSCYFSPNTTIEEYESWTLELAEVWNRIGRRALVGGDFNAKAQLWGEKKTDAKRQALMETMEVSGMMLLNEGSEFTFRRETTGSIIDLTLVGTGIADKMSHWRIREEDLETLADHMWIDCQMEDCLVNIPHRKKQYAVKKMDKTRFVEVFQEQTSSSNRMVTSEDRAVQLQEALIGACDKCIPTRSRRGRRENYWWNADISRCRKECNKLRRRLKKNGDEQIKDKYKASRNKKGAAPARNIWK